MYPGRIEKPNIETLKQTHISIAVQSIDQQHLESELNHSIVTTTQRLIDQNSLTKFVKSYKNIPIINNILREKKLERVLNKKSKKSKLISEYSIVTNSQIISDMMEDNYFVSTLFDRNVFFYQIGTFNSIKIYVNAFLRWNDKNIYVIKNNFYWFDDYVLEDVYYEHFSPFTPRKKASYNFYFQENLSMFVDKYKIL